MGGGAAERLRAAGRRDSHKAARAALAVLAEGGVDEAEQWEATEQLCVAQLDCGQHEEAARTLARVVGRFPSAQHTRTRRLQAAAAEARGDAETAGEVCARLAGRARDDGGAATDVVAMKRQAALLREAGDLAGAVEQLNRVVCVGMSDVEAWLELADVFQHANSLRHAAFCLEQVLLAMPWNTRVWVRAAEAWYSAGEPLLARKLFAHAVELSRGPDERQLAWCVDARAARALRGVPRGGCGRLQVCGYGRPCTLLPRCSSPTDLATSTNNKHTTFHARLHSFHQTIARLLWCSLAPCG